MTSQSPLLNDQLTLEPDIALSRASAFKTLALDSNSAAFSPSDAIPFFLNDLKLYLDTHPCDLIIHALYRRTAHRAGMTVIEHVSDTYCLLRWTWIDGPWPWEKQKEVGENVGI